MNFQAKLKQIRELAGLDEKCKIITREDDRKRISKLLGH